MSAQRSAGFLLVVLQAVALGYGYRTWVFSSIVLGAGLIGWLFRVRWVAPRTARHWPLVLAVLCVLQRTLVPRDWYVQAESFLFPDAYLIAAYFLVFQVGQLFVIHDRDHLPSYLPLLALVTLVFAADVPVRGQARSIYQTFSLGWICLSALYYAASRTSNEALAARRSASHGILLGTVLLVAGGLAWFAASNLYSHAHQLERILLRMTRPSALESAGFSGQGGLGSVAQQKENSGDRVALRIWAERSPGYLRGRAFDTYLHAAWQASRGRTALRAEPAIHLTSAPHTSGRVRTFSLSRRNMREWQRMEIWPNQPFREVVFAPSRVTAVQGPFEQLTVDADGILETDELPVGLPYLVWSSTAPEGDDEPLFQLPQTVNIGSRGGSTTTLSAAERLTALPAGLDPRVYELARQVAGHCTTDGERIATVERYFLENFQYRFGIDVPVDADPLTYFLLERPAAHCEYFASGAAVLLRAVGVPCRYVTGFVAVERNDHGGYWVARNRDAHAWVEAYDRDRGWVLVEATPADGIPGIAATSTTGQIWDAWRARWQQAVASIRQGGLKAILTAVGTWLRHPEVWALLLLFAAVWVIWRLAARLYPQFAIPRDPRWDEFTRLLRRMDRRWRKAGVARQPCETPHQFAVRLTSVSTAAEHCQAADWYRQYATLRYGGCADAAALKALGDAFVESLDSHRSYHDRFRPTPIS